MQLYHVYQPEMLSLGVNKMPKHVVDEYYILDNFYLEDVYDYFKPLDKKEAEEYLSRLYAKNNRRLRNNYLRAFFRCLLRGIEEGTLVLVICTSSVFRGALKKMASNLLLPFSGFEAVANIIQEMRSESLALHIGGYFDPKTNLVFGVIENPEEEIKGKGEKLVYILHHELCHYTSANHWNEFDSLFKDKYLIPYYQNMFKQFGELIEKDYDEKKCKKLSDILVKRMLERERYYNMSQSTKHKEENHIVLCYEEMKNIDEELANVWANLVIDSFTTERRMDITFNILYNAYLNNGWNLPKKFKHYQEILFPSEVICVLAYILNEEKEFIDMLKILFR